MADGVNTHPIQLIINYWEIKPTSIGERLDELIRQGITHVATFVPWQAVESDIAHSFTRFLQALAEREMTASLILTPEVGVHYPYCGLPKDIISKTENLAKHSGGHLVAVHLPPNSFPLPSLTGSEFSKRYHNFLLRIDALIADLEKLQPHIVDRINIVMTGSYWKYYRAPQFSAGRAFGGTAGDYSSGASIAYRQRVEQLFSQREFGESGAGIANKWKTRSIENVNRRWYYQQSEDVFRYRSIQFLRKKAGGVRIKQTEFYTPEADPSVTYSNFLQTVAGGHADLFRLSRLVDEAAMRASYVADHAEGSTDPWLRWSDVGSFRTLQDSQKQFLILKSVILICGQGGSVVIDENVWDGLSQSFRTRTEALARAMALGELRVINQALYLTPHLWSSPGVLWDELWNRLGARARMISSINLVLRDQHSKFMMVDPAFIITRDVLQKLLEWAKSGRVLVLPRGPLYTESAQLLLEQTMLSGKGGVNINLGVAYNMVSIGEGRVVLYDLPEGLSMKGETLASWQTFLSSLFSIAGLQQRCGVSDGRLEIIPLQKGNDGMGVFVLNGTPSSVAADLVFPGEVSVSDLAATLWAKGHNSEEQAATVPADRYSLEVPPFGILPIAVDGLAEVEERRLAALSSEILKANVNQAAVNELQGLNMSEGISTLWS